jgi:hypothetical protein
MLVAAALVPHPPLLIPSVAAGAADELDELRDACRKALDVLEQSRPDLLVVVGGGDGDGVGVAHPSARGSMRPFGVDVDVVLPGTPTGLEPASADVGDLPLSLTIAAWLLEQRGWSPPLLARAISFATPSQQAADLGSTMSGYAPRVALLALGDGSAALSRKAPGYLVQGAGEWQQLVSAAFAEGERERLLALSDADAQQFVASGRPVWQVMAGGFGDSRLESTVHADIAPYGVAYLVVTWLRSAQ